MNANCRCGGCGIALTQGTKLEIDGCPNVGEVFQIDYSYVHFLQSENNPKPFKKIWPFPIIVLLIVFMNSPSFSMKSNWE